MLLEIESIFIKPELCGLLGNRSVSEVSFCRLWRELLPNIVICRPMTDLCWTCRQLYRSIAVSSNLPEVVKSAKLRKLSEHLDQAQMERSVYQEMVRRSATSHKHKVLGPHLPCSSTETCHYSFDFAQQVHLPHDPLQPGPMYFLCPRKVGIFGICCEAVPSQVNYLIDEAHCTSKGSAAVISYLHHFFNNYGLGEEEVDLHCDNCCGQNKNNYVLAYLMWRVLTKQHLRIRLHFLLPGHTKFAPDWCFGLLKQKFWRTEVSTLSELQECIQQSTVNGLNQVQLVGPENGPADVPLIDWHTFLTPCFKALPRIKGYHHFSFLSDHPGQVHFRELWQSEEK